MGTPFWTTKVIALEGLDGVGKSTAVRALAARLSAEIVTNPPARLRAERAAADALPPADRRAWYWRANAASMEDARGLIAAGTPVVMDRCCMSTAVYGAAELGRVATWADVPIWVPRPDVVFLITLSEEERQRRQRIRNADRTVEESRLDRDAAFRERVLEGYRSLGAVLIDASRSVEEIVTEIVADLGERR